MEIPDTVPPPQKKTHDNKKSTMNEDVFPINNMGIFQCHVSFVGV